MPRRRYYRRYTRVVAPRKKWATNMKTGSLFNQTPATTPFHLEEILVQNSTQSSTPTPVVVKTGNFKIQGDCYLSVSSGSGSGIIATSTSVIVYVVYLPEVVIAQANPIVTINDHPEWILAWKLVDINMGSGTTTTNTATFSFSSRLKRNLNSGDTVALVAVVKDTTGANQYSMRLNYAAQYWTCTN